MSWTTTDGLEWMIQDATAEKADGVFSATVVWNFRVPITGPHYAMLPDVVAARYVAAGIYDAEFCMLQRRSFGGPRLVSAPCNDFCGYAR